MRRPWAYVVGTILLGVCVRAEADPCRSVEMTFKPMGDLQIAVWIETDQGAYVDTAFITRSTGVFGLANRPGAPKLKTAVRFPYGRRDMVLPVWAHKRNKQYGLVMMGGSYGNSIDTCMANGASMSQCDDRSIGYHELVSSSEPFYCSPSGGVLTKVNGVDVVSCASSFFGSKGAYAAAPAFSYYPPRADLTSFNSGDSAEARDFAKVNDLVAISGATPQGTVPVNPPIRWRPPADGKYVAKVELSMEADFNPYHQHPPQDDLYVALNNYGKNFLGQPSVVYSIPFTVGDTLDVETTTRYSGYGDWDGATGTEHAPDMTISEVPGTGAGRLLDHTDASGTYRVRVAAHPTCDNTDGGTSMCMSPEAPTMLTLGAHPTAIDVAFMPPSNGTLPNRVDIRYRENQPITDADFISAIPSSNAPPAPTAGEMMSSTITGLRPETVYYVAVRTLAPCEAASKIAVSKIMTAKPQYVTLSGCFIATAAFGSPLMRQVTQLRAFRDRVLLETTAGQLFTAVYYTFSPPLAAAISTAEPLRRAVRTALGALL